MPAFAPFPITPYDHIALFTELSALLAAAPVELRTVNLSDRFTFAGGIGQDFDDGLADFDATDFLDGEGDDIETGDDVREDKL